MGIHDRLVNLFAEIDSEHSQAISNLMSQINTLNLQLGETRSLLAAAESRNAELAAANEAQAGTIAFLRTEVSRLSTEKATLESQLSQYQLEVQQLQAAVAANATRITDLERQLAECQAGQPEPEPEPEPVRIMAAGACPRAGEGRNMSGVVSRYGAKASVRWFDGGSGFSAIPVRPSESTMVHCSWKTNSLSNITAAAIKAAFVNLKDNDAVEVWHEIDVKHRKAIKASGQAIADSTLQSQIAMKNEFYRLVKLLRESGEIPNVRVVNTLAWWSFTPYITNVDLYKTDADVLGVDMDGVENSEMPYLSFTDANPRIKVVAQLWYNGRWAVPEFAMDRAISDPSGEGRAAWIQDEARQCDLDGCEWFLYFDQNWWGTGRGELTLQVEQDALRGLVK